MTLKSSKGEYAYELALLYYISTMIVYVIFMVFALVMVIVNVQFLQIISFIYWTAAVGIYSL